VPLTMMFHRAKG